MKKLLLDTNALLWAALDLLDDETSRLVRGPSSDVYFSTASIWEIGIKNSRHRPDFRVNAAEFRREILNTGSQEINIEIEHILATGNLPAIHKDPFDRILIAQANIQHLTLLTADITIAKYPGDIQLIPTPKPDFDKEWAE